MIPGFILLMWHKRVEHPKMNPIILDYMPVIFTCINYPQIEVCIWVQFECTTLNVWLVVWNMTGLFFPYWEFLRPKWRTHIFHRGRSTTNQNLFLLRSTPTKILASEPGSIHFALAIGCRGYEWYRDRTRMISGSFKSGMNVLTPRLCSIQLLPLRLIQPPFLIVCSSSDGEITIFG